MPVRQTKLVPEQLKTAIQNDRGPLGFFMNGSGATQKLITEPPPKPKGAPPVARVSAPVATAPSIAATVQSSENKTDASPMNSGVMKHFDEADSKLKLTPPEQALYFGHLKSLWAGNGPVYGSPDDPAIRHGELSKYMQLDTAEWNALNGGAPQGLINQA